MLKNSFRAIMRPYLSDEGIERLMAIACLDPERVSAIYAEKGYTQYYPFVVVDRRELVLAEPLADIEPFGFLRDLSHILDAALTEFYEEADTDLEYQEWLTIAPDVELIYQSGYWVAVIGNWQIWVSCDDLRYSVLTKMTVDGYCRPGCTCVRCQDVREQREMEGVAQ